MVELQEQIPSTTDTLRHFAVLARPREADGDILAAAISGGQLSIGRRLTFNWSVLCFQSVGT
jgi:hypothetical protein